MHTIKEGTSVARRPRETKARLAAVEATSAAQERELESVKATLAKLSRLQRELIAALEFRGLIQKSRLIKDAVARVVVEGDGESEGC